MLRLLNGRFALREFAMRARQTTLQSAPVGKMRPDPENVDDEKKHERHADEEAPLGGIQFGQVRFQSASPFFNSSPKLHCTVLLLTFVVSWSPPRVNNCWFCAVVALRTFPLKSITSFTRLAEALPYSNKRLPPSKFIESGVNPDGIFSATASQQSSAANFSACRSRSTPYRALSCRALV